MSLLYIPIVSCIAHTRVALSKTKPATHPVSIALAFSVSKEIKYTRQKQWYHSVRMRRTEQALSRNSGKTKVAVCHCHPTNTVIHLQSSSSCMSGGYFSYKKHTNNILTFESSHIPWLRAAHLSHSNQEFSLTFLRGDINTRVSLQTGYVAFRELNKLFWRQSGCWLPLKVVSLSAFPVWAQSAQRPRPYWPLCPTNTREEKETTLLPQRPGLTRHSTVWAIKSFIVHFTKRQYSHTH